MNEVPRILACCRVSIREADIFRLWIQHYAPCVDAIAVVIVAEGGERISELEGLCRDSLDFAQAHSFSDELLQLSRRSFDAHHP